MPRTSGAASELSCFLESLASNQSHAADFLVAARLPNDDLDVATKTKQDAHETIGRKAAKLAIQQQRDLRARFACFVSDGYLRHVALVDNALNLREQFFLLDKWITNSRLRSAPSFFCAHPDPVCRWLLESPRNRAEH